MGQSSQPHELGGGLKSRHVTMLSIAGVIGASLFVGSSVAIAEAGPAVLLAYLFAGLLVVLGTGYPAGSQHRRHDPALMGSRHSHLVIFPRHYPRLNRQ